MKRILHTLCIVLAVLIVVVSMTTLSFSWFKPGSRSGTGLQFTEITSVRSTDCELVTYSGTNENGVISYSGAVDNTELELSANTSGDKTTPTYLYFKTVITNNNKEYDTNVSLYLSSFNVDSNGGDASIGVAVPTNTYRSFYNVVNDVHIIRNAYISSYTYDEIGSGSLEVEWFVRCDAGSVTFNPSQVYLMYN